MTFKCKSIGQLWGLKMKVFGLNLKFPAQTKTIPPNNKHIVNCVIVSINLRVEIIIVGTWFNIILGQQFHSSDIENDDKSLGADCV